MTTENSNLSTDIKSVTQIYKQITYKMGEEEKKKKKKKKDKHHKKKSKKHKSKKYRSDSSDESSGDEWEESGITTSVIREDDNLEEERLESKSCLNEQPTTTQPLVSSIDTKEPPKRDDWMSSSLLDAAVGTTHSRENKTKERKSETRRKDEEKNLEVYRSRELNPTFKKTDPPTSASVDNSRVSDNVAPRKSVGDGGSSWIHKAYERAKERAKEENIPLEVIVKQRWGSMEKLEALLNVANRKSRPSSSGSKSTSSSSGWRKTISQKSEPKSSHRSQESPERNLESDKVSLENSGKTYNTDVMKKIDDNVVDNTEISISAKQIPKVTKKKVLSEEEKNKLNAKILRAELMGDDDLVATLRKQLEGEDTEESEESETSSSHRKRKDSSSSESSDDGEQVVLTRTDKHGNLYPVKLNDDVDGKTKRKKKKIISTHDKETGERVRYFEDDDNTDLKSMVEQERLTSADDQQAMLARLAGKHLGRTKGDDYTIDDMFVQASATKGETKVENKRIKERAIAEDKLQKKQLHNCKVCFESASIAKHLIISVGTNVYLTLPTTASLTEGHCQIVPMRHISAQTYLDENVFQEIRNLKKSLVSMFSSDNEDIIFLETCKSLRGSYHCIIDCIPVPKEIGDMAPIYFKKAITETGSEWSDNKKLITVNAAGGVPRAIPKGLPYFAVEFGSDGGFGHIIEDESFPHYFGKEIVGGMLDLEPRLWIRPPKESFGLHKKKVLKFSESWKKFDWTSKVT